MATGEETVGSETGGKGVNELERKRMSPPYMAQEFLDEPRCKIARKMLKLEKAIRQSIARTDGADHLRTGRLMELKQVISKVRLKHETECPGCGAKE